MVGVTSLMGICVEGSVEVLILDSCCRHHRGGAPARGCSVGIGKGDRAHVGSRLSPCGKLVDVAVLGSLGSLGSLRIFICSPGMGLRFVRLWLVGMEDPDWVSSISYVDSRAYYS